MTRKLVTIRKIKELVSIKGADFIELAMIDGWQCVVKKGDFIKGESVLFFEIDSFLPEIEQFEYLRKGHCFKQMEVDGTLIGGFRLRTIKLRGQLSQGLVISLSAFPKIDFSDLNKDYSEEVGVIKWEPRISPQLQGFVKGMFPTDIIRKTNQDRVQNMTRTLTYHQDDLFEVSEKLDGTSSTYYRYETEEEVKEGVCSRNLDLKEDKTLYWIIEKKYTILEKLKEFKLNIAIQGEIIGEGIQKNPYNISGNDFYVFDIWDIEKQQYFSFMERYEMCNRLGLKHIPVLEHTFLEDYNNVDKLLEYAEDISYLNKKTQREGIVFKSECYNEKGEIISFKVISNKFLLKEKD